MQYRVATVLALQVFFAHSALCAGSMSASVVGDVPVGRRQPIIASSPTPSPMVIGPGNHVLYPTSANVHGAFNQFFQTKMTILNMTNTGYDIRAGFSTGAGEVAVTRIHIGPGESLTSDNIVDDLFGLSGGGAIDLDSRSYDTRTDHLFLTNAVVYVDIGGGGRFSMAIQPADFTGFVTPSRPAILVGVSVNGTTRTNVGCASNSPNMQHLTAQAFFADGSAASNVIGIDMGPYAWGQVAITGGPFNNGTVLITTNDPAGAVCYGTEVNNPTGDATFYLGIPY
jgi:hypothetical protein